MGVKVADCSQCGREMGLVHGFGRDQILRTAPHKNLQTGGRCVPEAPDVSAIRERVGGRRSRSVPLPVAQP